MTELFNQMMENALGITGPLTAYLLDESSDDDSPTQVVIIARSDAEAVALAGTTLDSQYIESSMVDLYRAGDASSPGVLLKQEWIASLVEAGEILSPPYLIHAYRS